MTTVNITTNKNTVTIDEDNSSVIEVATQGPQGPQFSSSGISLTDTNKVNKSIIYYDSASGSYKADSTWTTSTLTDGGNF
tara:strand:+ start:5357 stop:5596 length:240 start_codon:yes stop_codon:yes gene_type:complete